MNTILWYISWFTDNLSLDKSKYGLLIKSMLVFHYSKYKSVISNNYIEAIKNIYK